MQAALTYLVRPQAYNWNGDGNTMEPTFPFLPGADIKLRVMVLYVDNYSFQSRVEITSAL